VILNIEKLAHFLREAQEAHHKFEIESGETDPDWAAWYAAWLGPRLASCELPSTHFAAMKAAVDEAIAEERSFSRL
jgi:hypothetical protein